MKTLGFWKPGCIEDEYGFKSIIDYDCSNCGMAFDKNMNIAQTVGQKCERR